MTVYEHAMLGVNGALAAGLNRRHGWHMVAWAGVAAILPDLDGLTIQRRPNELRGKQRHAGRRGDKLSAVTTIIFAASMFAMLRWPTWIRTIATSSLVAVAGYMAMCGMYYRAG